MSDSQSTLASQQTLIAALCDPRRFPHPARRVRLIETHISWVLLAGRHAYKIKKALDLGFLDYSRLEGRRICCEEEIRLNCRLAPGVYLDAIPIGGRADAPELGARPAIEYAVHMRRFPAAALMDRLLTRGQVTPQHIDELAETVARFHAGLPAATGPFGSCDSVHAAVRQNFGQLLALPGKMAPPGVAALESACEAEYAGCAAAIEARRMQGWVRECHGDLHLGNIALIGGRPVPFDGIEFNAGLRWIDVMSELAFTVMDLLHRDRPDYAWRFLNACLQVSGDYGGVAVLRYYLAYRATVRAKVSAIRAGQPGLAERASAREFAACRSYLALAERCLNRRRPALILTHGLPGCGKTTFSQIALERLGAIRLRSDVERKRLFGLAALDDSRALVGDIYGADATRRTYGRLLELAQTLLTAGFPVIVDAAFLDRGERSQFRLLAGRLAVPCVIASLHATDAALQARIVRRHNDASEADLGVLELLRRVQEPLSGEELEGAVIFDAETAFDGPTHAECWARLLHLAGGD